MVVAGFGRYEGLLPAGGLPPVLKEKSPSISSQLFRSQLVLPRSIGAIIFGLLFHA